jgi:hypothetical protein
MNLAQPMRNAPASGGAMMDKPGTNLAMISELTPQRSKRFCVLLTQESGSSEILHKVFSMRMPKISPSRYQPQSAARQASTAPKNTALSDSWP